MSTALQPLDKQVADVRGLLEQMKPQLALALPKHMTPDRMARIVLTQIRKTPKLLRADRYSLMSAIMTAAQLGLELDGIEAHLVPFENRKKNILECQFIADFKGLAKLAWQSGMVDDMRPRCVFEGDEFEYVQGDDERITHKPISPAHKNWPKKDGKPIVPEDREIVAAYAIVKIRGGGKQREVVYRHDLEALRQKQAGPQRDPQRQGPWWTHFEAMCRKTALRRALKLVPRSSDRASWLLQQAVHADESAEAGLPQDGWMVELPPGALEQPKGALDTITEQLTERETPPEDSAPASGPSSPAQAEPVAPGGASPSSVPADCAGCGKNEPPPEGTDEEGRAWHGECLRIVQKANKNAQGTLPMAPPRRTR